MVCPPFPYKVAAGGGGFIANASPIICGGNVFIGNSYKITNDCFLIERKQWKRTISMRIPLESMASTIWLNQLLLTGGQQQIFFRYQKSIQTFAFSQLVSKRRSLYKLNYLPVQLSKHCSIKIDEDTILVTDQDYLNSCKWNLTGRLKPRKVFSRCYSNNRKHCKQVL